VGVFALCGAIASTVFFGLAPALQATRLELVRTMRGELTRDARPGRARNALIALQVGASALLLICAAIFLRSAFAASTAESGLRTSDTVMLGIANEPLRAAMLQAVSSEPSIAAVAVSWPPVLSGALAEADRPAKTSTRLPVEYKFVSPEYFSVLGIDVIRGRGFTQAERSAEAGIVVVSETIARRLWPNRPALGQLVRLDASRQSGARSPGASAPQLPSRAFTVVGVVRDVRVGRGLFEFRDAGVYVPTGSRTLERRSSCGSTAIRSRHGCGCSNDSRRSIPRWERSERCERSPEWGPTSCESRSGLQPCSEAWHSS
jgi:hypothetical protein